MLKQAFGALGLCLALGSQAAVAQTTIKWMHLEVNPNQVKIWEEVARALRGQEPRRQGRDAVPGERGLQGQAPDRCCSRATGPTSSIAGPAAS